MSADPVSARNPPSRLTSIKSFADMYLTLVKVRGTLVVALPLTFVGEVNCNHAPSYH